MKLKLTARLAYLLGIWKARASTEGVGIEGRGELADIFIREVLSQKLTTGERIQLRGEKVFFYHSRLRAFFQECERERLGLFSRRNVRTAAYLAGWFDACGGAERGVPFLARADREDEFLLDRLGFRTRRVRGKLFVSPAREYASLILPFCRHSVCRALQPGNERDPR